MSDNFLKKYSPKKLEDFHIDNYTLFSNNINLLITGPSSSGKTSLLISYINYYYENNNNNIYTNENILFMNNLKDQGIQFCRNNVKTFCQTASSIKIKKKIIAIDDIDEFSDVSQQVIANCLTKYSNNILCIATCSNTLKVFNGLKSRMAFITIFNPTYDKLLTLTNNIITSENITIDSKLIPLIIESSNSSYKILLNTLQKIKIFDKTIDTNNVYELITSINFNTFNKYINSLKQHQLLDAINILFNISESGISVIDILFEFFFFIKHTKTTLDDPLKSDIIKIISKYIILFNNLHEDSIELAFFTNDLLLLF